jgi:pyrimidine operon attenuation protein/uracil phosphoribosyltransferase
MTEKIKILDDKQLKQKINRLSWQVYEDNINEKNIVLVGISNRGSILAKELMKVINKISNVNVILGRIDLDKKNPYDKTANIDLSENDYKNNVVILCDDVLNSGKTLIYSSKIFLSTPLKKLSTVVLVNRDHNLYPIKSDYVGISLSTTLKEYVNVDLTTANKGVYLS